MKTRSNNPLVTILVISSGLLIVYLVTDYKWCIFISLTISIIGITSRYLTQIIDYWWMSLSWLLSLIIPKIILGFIFYFILYPISLLSKINRQDPLKLKRSYKTLFKDVNKSFSKEVFKKPW